MEYVFLVRGVSSDFVFAVCNSKESADQWIDNNGYLIGDLHVQKFKLFKGY